MSKKIAIIYSGTTQYYLHENGEISKECIKPSGNWKLLGFIRCNNFGNVVERISLEEALSIPNWFSRMHYKNGKQKWYIEDIDHGTRRLWVNPEHYITKREEK